MRSIYREGFFKISRRIVDSSLWFEEGDVIKVFMFLLERSQDPAGPRDGRVFIARQQLAARCFLSTERLEACLVTLAGPDVQSRTSAGDGRRIEVLPNGFRVLNYGLYHDEAKDRLLAEARSKAGQSGGLKSAESRRIIRLRASKTQAKSKQVQATDTETETETETTEQRTSENGGPVGLVVKLPPIPKAPTAEQVATRHVACFNAVFDRGVGVSPEIVEKVEVLLATKYRPWQIVALSVMVAAQSFPQDMRKTITPQIILRDGKHARTTNGANGPQTFGATHWLERALGRLDQTVLDERQASIAAAFGVLDQLQQCGVGVRKESGL